MPNHYLPDFDKEKSKAYTPIGIRNLLEKAIEIKNGDIEAVFKDKHQNKNLIELYHASFLALAIKKWLKNNPNKHSWKTSKKKSIPCEKFKNILKSNKISFVEEFTPLIDRMFSIDIAFPDKKIGIEINGNQHYSSDGQLKPYYKDRHDLIEKKGGNYTKYIIVLFIMNI